MIYRLEKLILAGSGDKKRLVSEAPLIKQYFSDNLHLFNTGDINDKNILTQIHNMKHLFESDLNKYYDKVIQEIQEMILIADDKLLFGLEEINKSLKVKGIKKIIYSDEINKSQLDLDADGNCEIVVIPSHKLKIIGIEIIGIKWF